MTRTTCDRRRRGGYSLCELLVVLLISATVTPVGVMVLHRMWRWDRFVREQFAAEHNLLRLGQSFRADAQQAIAFSSGERNGQFQLATGAIIEYRVEANRVVRQRMDGEQHVVHTDSFRLNSGCEARFEASQRGDRVGAELRVSGERTAIPLHVEARVGLFDNPPTNLPTRTDFGDSGIRDPGTAEQER